MCPAYLCPLIGGHSTQDNTSNTRINTNNNTQTFIIGGIESYPQKCVLYCVLYCVLLVSQ